MLMKAKKTRKPGQPLRPRWPRAGASLARRHSPSAVRASKDDQLREALVAAGHRDLARALDEKLDKPAVQFAAPAQHYDRFMGRYLPSPRLSQAASGAEVKPWPSLRACRRPRL